jgi:hypothetical protein
MEAYTVNAASDVIHGIKALDHGRLNTTDGNAANVLQSNGKRTKNGIF